MPSPNPNTHYRTPAAWGRAGAGRWFCAASAATGRARLPAPDAKHRTPTVTPTPTDQSSGVGTQNEEDTVEFDPFIGYESSPAFSTSIPNLCGDAVVSPGGEAWVLSDSSFYIGDPNRFRSATLYVQRCVGDFQPWNPTGSTGDTGVFHLLPPVVAFLPTATPVAPIARALILPQSAFRVFPTPVPIDRAPVLAPHLFNTSCARAAHNRST
jgi:hypothetical protein